MVNIWKCCFKLYHKRPIHEEFDFFEEVGEGGGSGPKWVGWPLFINFYFNYNCWSYENEEFLISSKSSCGRYTFREPQEGLRNDLKKSLIQNGGLHPYKKFQHSSSISKCSKIGGTELSFEGWRGGFRFPNARRGSNFKKAPLPKFQPIAKISEYIYIKITIHLEWMKFFYLQAYGVMKWLWNRSLFVNRKYFLLKILLYSRNQDKT